MPTARCYLYVPGDQPDKIARAATRGADALILDLEDAVAPSAKANARKTVSEWLREQDSEIGPSLWVRINSDELLEEDLAAAAWPALTGVVVSKADRDLLERTHLFLEKLEEEKGFPKGSVAVVALLESAASVIDATQIARAPRLATLALGEADLKAELGVEPSPDDHEMVAIRMQIVLACAAAGLDPPIGPVSTDFSDLDVLYDSTQVLKRLGFGGRSAIHPAQVWVINKVFTPTPQEVETAKLLVDQHEKSLSEGKGAYVGADGRMVDEAVVRAARRTLAVAESARRKGIPR